MDAFSVAAAEATTRLKMKDSRR